MITYAWLGAILASFGWLLFRVIGWGRSGGGVAGLKLLGVPALTLAALTGPLWVEAVKEEIDCRLAGLSLDAPIQAGKEGIYWRSHDPGPGYAAGNNLVHKDWRRDVVRSLLRGVVEGKIGYVEVPDVDVGGWAPSTTNRKFYLARKDSTQVECFIGGESKHGDGAFHEVIGNLPPGACIASENTEGVQSRFQLGTRPSGRVVGIRDRKTGKEVAAYWYATVNRSETWLRIFGIRKLRPVSCSPDRLDALPAAHLVSMVFASEDGTVVSLDRLSEAVRAPWRPAALNVEEDVVPAGPAGLSYWVGRNQIRMLTRDDRELWNAATRGYRAQQEKLIFGNVYLITGKIRLPTRLYGPDSVDWILEKGASVPPGPRGHGTFYRIGEGCIWGGCEKLENEPRKR